MTDEKQDAQTILMTPTVLAESRKPTIFRGEPGQDPIKWLKEYQKVSLYNRWDDTMQLANVYFFLDGTVRKWYENNEGNFTSWTLLENGLKAAFGDTQTYVRRAKNRLKSRAQQPGECIQSYIQDVLELCKQAEPNMPEEDKVSHLMKGVAEYLFQALLARDVQTSADFTRWCLYIEEMKQKRLRSCKFERLPNVVLIAANDEVTDLMSLIRQVVREEMQHVFSQPLNIRKPELQSIEAIIKDEVDRSLATITSQPITSNQQFFSSAQRPTLKTPRRPTTYAARSPIIVPPPQYEAQRKTDLWRTADSRPVCFHCGRPGHVVRYCRERRAIFNDYRRNNPRNYNLPDEYENNANHDAPFRRRSPSPARGRSPTRRTRSRSPTPYRISNQSPNREEN
ncbi:CCHC-type domain-containing protein [Trichonephila clavata]|uniref:CCHC-type domain-containing protein n=1 Tax=Trichonephila clavata TaxID=2740835 RepID=A0A8X6GJX4_TRICU|nr:CCHC-type domain-containing protein [Trichonephila clavata]